MRGCVESMTGNALAAPGVLAVLTGRDLIADGMKPIPHRPFSPHPADIPLENTDGTPMFTAPHFRARERTRCGTSVKVSP